jgi:hypothetical protein
MLTLNNQTFNLLLFNLEYLICLVGSIWFLRDDHLKKKDQSNCYDVFEMAKCVNTSIYNGLRLNRPD